MMKDAALSPRTRSHTKRKNAEDETIQSILETKLYKFHFMKFIPSSKLSLN